MSKTRVAVTSLAISSALIAVIGINEGWTERPVIPVKGDRPTIYDGMTYSPLTGKSIKMTDDSWSLCNMGDARACGVRLLTSHLQSSSKRLKACLGNATLTQGEYDILMDFAHQYGEPTTCKSSIVRNYHMGNYPQACSSYLKYKFQGADKFDCSTTGNKRCYGVWTRQVGRYKSCMQEVRNAS